jgi:hypothetical protein
MSGGLDDGPEVVKWYTRARRFPQLIGRTPDGARIWGGPYTFPQVTAAAAVLLVGVNTAGIWGRFGVIGNAVVLLGAAYGTALLLGRIPIGSRNPLSSAAGLLRALGAPAHGTLGGRPLRIRGPHRVRTTLVVDDRAYRSCMITEGGVGAPLPPPVSPPAPASASSAPPARPRQVPALSGVQRLLAGAAVLSDLREVR